MDDWNPQCPTQLKRGGHPNPGLIFYSLGNFITTMPTAACRTGAVITLDLSVDDTGRLHLNDLKATPTVATGGGMTRSPPMTVLLEEFANTGTSPNHFKPHIERLALPQNLLEGSPL